MSEVEQYFSYRGQKLELPRDVAEQRYIYIRHALKIVIERDIFITP
jgi:hypothetical protein